MEEEMKTNFGKMERILTDKGIIKGEDKEFLLKGLRELYKALETAIHSVAQSETNMMKDVKDIKELLLNCNTIGRPSRPYADVAKTVLSLGTSDSNNKIKETMKNIKPEELGIGVMGVRETRKGLQISCRSMEESKRLIDAVKKGNKDVQVLENKPRRPHLKIVGLNDSLEDKDLLDCIRKQNTIGNDVIIKVVKKWMNPASKKYSVLLLIEDVSVCNKFVEKGFINIGWDCCKVYEDFNVLRCFKCCGFNHKIKECTKSSICHKCGGKDHVSSDCKQLKKECLNCVEANAKLNLKLDVNHGPLSFECSVYKRFINSKKNNANYNK